MKLTTINRFWKKVYIYHLMNCNTILKSVLQKLHMYRSTYMSWNIFWFLDDLGPMTDLAQRGNPGLSLSEDGALSAWRRKRCWILFLTQLQALFGTKWADGWIASLCRYTCPLPMKEMDAKTKRKNKQKVEQSGVMDSQWKNWVWKTNEQKVKQTGVMDCLLVAPVHLPIHSFPSHLFKRIKTKTTKIKKI